MEGLQLKYEFEFNDGDFWNISRMVTEHAGIELPESKKSLVYSRLVRRLRTLGIMRFSEYYDLVSRKLKGGDDSEFMVLINAVTTNVTHLFREHHHFDHLKEHLAILAETKKRIRIWCCAASIGAEPWSVAMVVHDFKQEYPSVDVQILASDIDSEVLKQADVGMYDVNPEIVKANPYLAKYLQEAESSTENQPLQHKVYQIKNDIRPYVQFKKINLLHNWEGDVGKGFDFVFCRNVIIYFSKKTQKTLFDKMTKVMNIGSFLYLGHSESLLGLSQDFENLRHTTYRKIK